MTLTYSYLLIPYAFFLLLFLAFTIINVYNLVKYGGLDIVGFWATFIFLAGAVIVIFISYGNLIIFDWQQSITIFGTSNFLLESI